MNKKSINLKLNKMKQMKTVLNKKLFFLFLLLGTVLSVNAQNNSSTPEVICAGSIKHYRVDKDENAGEGTTNSIYAWSVTPFATEVFRGTLTLNLGPNSSSNRIEINWGNSDPGNYVIHVVETNNGCIAPEVTFDVTIAPVLTASVSISASANPICAGSSVTFTAIPTNEGTNPSYQWYVGSTAVGTNSPTFTSNSLLNNDVVSVVMTSNATPCLAGSPATSPSITVTVNPILSASVSISASANPICAGSSVTFTAIPTNEGTNPSYQWYVGSTAVGTNSPTFASNSLLNNDVVSVVMTSNATPCLAGSPVTSPSITVNTNTVSTSVIFHD